MRRFVTTAGMSLCFFLISISSISAQSKEEILYPYKTDVPPVIDGVLNDQVWQAAPSETGFRTYSPDYGIDMVENTVVWYAYDRENLYFAFRCYDSRPEQIKTSVTARDRIRSDDWICINLIQRSSITVRVLHESSGYTDGQPGNGCQRGYEHRFRLVQRRKNR